MTPEKLYAPLLKASRYRLITLDAASLRCLAFCELCGDTVRVSIKELHRAYRERGETPRTSCDHTTSASVSGEMLSNLLRHNHYSLIGTLPDNLGSPCRVRCELCGADVSLIPSSLDFGPPRSICRHRIENILLPAQSRIDTRKVKGDPIPMILAEQRSTRSGELRRISVHIAGCSKIPMTGRAGWSARDASARDVRHAVADAGRARIPAALSCAFCGGWNDSR